MIETEGGREREGEGGGRDGGMWEIEGESK